MTTFHFISSLRSLFSGTLISRITGLIREIVTAIVFGGSVGIAAFWMAFRFANLSRRLLGEGAMQSSFTPFYQELLNTDKAGAHRFFTHTVYFILLILGPLVLLSELVFTH